MRMTTLANLTPNANAPLRFTGERGEQFTIDVLDHDLIRVCSRPDGTPRLDRTWTIVGADGDTPREGRSRDDLSPFPCPAYQLDQSSDALEIVTERLRLRFDLHDPRIEWFDSAGQRFAADLSLRAYSYDRAGRSVFHYLERRTDEHYYGFGERAGTLDKGGMRFQMKNVDALGYNAETSDPLYKHIPFYITYIPALKTAYGLFYDNLATSVFDLGKEIDAFWGHFRYYAAEDGDLDYYLLYGPTIEAVVEKYARLTGRPMLPPRWALGYLGSTMYYTEAPNAQEQLKQFVDLCQQHDIPCDMFHLSSGYTTSKSGSRYVFTWNRSRIPSPQAMTATFHGAGMHVGANIKPYLLTDHPEFADLSAAGGLIRDADSDDPALTRFWSGGAFTSGAGGYVDFTSDAGYGWWQRCVREQLLAYGVDVPWNDNNEFELWDDAARCDGFGNPLPISLARPLQTLVMGRASYEAVQAHRPDQRPFVLTRSAAPGIQRYAQTWSGDNMTSWHSLRYNIPMGLGLSLSGMPNTGHDVGGFDGPAPDPELFVRWVQNGIFHPRFTIHSWNTDGTVNEPWMHPDVLPIVRETIKFRYRLLPYLYSLFFEAHQTGHPIIRPLVYHFPDDLRCHTESFDFLLGAHLLVASVLEPGTRTRRVYLPAGTWWCDFHTRTWYEGGQEIEGDAPLDRIPLFVRDGGIIPFGEPMRHVGAIPDSVRRAYAFSRSGSGDFTLIEDDGISLDYKHGGYTAVHLSLNRDGGSTTPRAERQVSGYPLPYESVEFIIAAGDHLRVKGGTLIDDRWHVSVPVT